jgi:hypothetical protein
MRKVLAALVCVPLVMAQTPDLEIRLQNLH